MKETLDTIHRMQSAGVITTYAIGGAVGATLYLEPAATLDVDVFVILPATPGSLISLSGIYEYLASLGYKPEGEHIVIGSWPVQFLTPGNALENDAVCQAREAEVESVKTRVMTAEHLLAIALQTGRAKDHARIMQFLSQNVVNMAKLQEILEGHQLAPRWREFRQRYLDE